MEELSQLQLLLDEYYTLSSLRAQERCEASLLELVRKRVLNYFYTRRLTPQDCEDLWGEVMLRLLKALRNSRTSTPIKNLHALALAAAKNIYCDMQRRDNPWNLLKGRVYFLTTDARYNALFARWMLQNQTLIGTAQMRGAPARATPTYTAFCRDHVAYLDAMLPGRSPSDARQVPLAELLLTLLQWVETPLPEPSLITHLAELCGVTRIRLDSLEEITASAGRSAEERLAAPEPERENINWEACWLEILTLSVSLRRLVLLSLDAALLRLLTGDTDPAARLASALEYPVPLLRDWMMRLPFEDDALAERLDMNKSALHAARSRVRKRLYTKFFAVCENPRDSASLALGEEK